MIKLKLISISFIAKQRYIYKILSDEYKFLNAMNIQEKKKRNSQNLSVAK